MPGNMSDSRPPPLTHADALDRKMDHLAEMIGNVQETVETRSADMQAIRVAVRDGIVAAASDPAVWAIAVESASAVIHQRAKAEAGTWLFGGIKTLLSRVFWVLALGLAIYMVGGWSALVSFVKNGVFPGA
jgi:hypothetical protein